MNNLVSIITPSYKSEKYISETIESVLKQTYKNWEMIIVDDCSPDNSNNVIESFIKLDTRIKLIRLDTNSGPAIARNKAIEEAQGRYIAFLDADDVWKKDKLTKQLDFMQKKDCALTYTAYEIMNETGELLHKKISTPLKVTYTDLLKSNHIGCLTAMYDTAKIGKIFMPLIQKRQDYGLWLKILRQTGVSYGIGEPLAIYRIMPTSVSSNKLDLLRYHYKLFREFENIGRLKTIYYLFWHVVTKLLYR